ncbi:TPA: hypothetical protein I6Y83_005269 [Vibrio parahaemolyticus]|nr:hypothetical protein [Vibrio parahaemolyticus]HAS3052293.1 hypothetical protein [Vibrio parahaemolyticus]
MLHCSLAAVLKFEWCLSLLTPWAFNRKKLAIYCLGLTWMWGYCLGLVEIGNVKSKGFTLMEITIVLTTLAFIALAALPVLLDIHRQAYAAMLHSSQSSLGTALKFFHAQSVIDNAYDQEHVHYIDRQVKTRKGMPEASADSIRALLEIDLPARGYSKIDVPCKGSDFCIIGQQNPNSAHFVAIPDYQFLDKSGVDRVVYIWPQGYTLAEEACYFYYVNQASTDSIVRGHVTQGC